MFHHFFIFILHLIHFMMCRALIRLTKQCICKAVAAISNVSTRICWRPWYQCKGVVCLSHFLSLSLSLCNQNQFWFFLFSSYHFFLEKKKQFIGFKVDYLIFGNARKIKINEYIILEKKRFLPAKKNYLDPYFRAYENNTYTLTHTYTKFTMIQK